MRRVFVLLGLLAVSCVPMPEIEPKTGKNEGPTEALPTPTMTAQAPTTPPPLRGSSLSCEAGYLLSDDWGCVISEERVAREREGESFRTAMAATEKLDLKMPLKDTPFKGTVSDVLQAYNRDAKAAEGEFDAWNSIAEGPSKPWSAAARCRQAQIYESLARRLELAEPPAVQLFSPKELAVMDKLDKSGRADLVEKGAQLRASRADAWRKKRESEEATTRQNVLFLLSTCVLRAIEERFSPPIIRAGAARLAELEGSTVPSTFAGQVNPPTERLTGKKWQAGLFTRARRVLEETR